jgi:YVTN family beta-propeller protein
VAVTPDGKTAYVTNYGDGTVTPITVATNTAGTPITVGSNPLGVAVTPDGKTAYVTNGGDGTVTPITVATNTAGTPITVGSYPLGVAVAPAPTVDSTSTSVACSPTSVVVGSATSCTATVTDTATSGATTPTGTVSFTSSPTSGAFGSSGSCTLGATGTSGVASCQLSFTPSAANSYTVTGNYQDDSTHHTSSGQSSSITASSPAAPTPTPTPTPVPPVVQPPACPAPSGIMSATKLGPIALGTTQQAIRQSLTHYHVTQNGFDDFCLAAGPGIRVGYPTAKLMTGLSRAQRSHDRGRIVLALTANRFYAADGVNPRSTLAQAKARLKLGRGITIGRNTWYVAAGSRGSWVLKTQGHTVLEVGIASSSLTGTRAHQRALLTSF